MEKMTKTEMIEFLKGMNRKEKVLEEEKKTLRSSVETMEEAIIRNSFAKSVDTASPSSSAFSPDRVLKILLNSQRDIELETKAMVLHLRDIYEKEDQIDFVRRCLRKLNGEDQALIRDAYINDTVIDHLSQRWCFSRSQLYRKLSKAIDALVTVYNASCQGENSFRAMRLMSEVTPYFPEGGSA